MGENMEKVDLYAGQESVTQNRLRDRISHRHDEIELIYVEKGSMDCQTNQEVFSLHKGDVCFINRQQMHRLIRTGQKDCQHLSVIISEEWLCDNPQIRNRYVRPMLDDPMFSHIRFDTEDKHNQRLHENMVAIEQLKEEQGCAYELEMAARIHEIFYTLYCAYTSQTDKRTAVDENALLLKKMVEYIEQHYPENLSLDQIAQAGLVSRAKCSRLFRQYTRQSPVAYLNSYRLEQAAGRLKQSTEPISDIAFAVGFGQQSYFNRLFLREYDCTPKEYRKTNFV